MSTGCPKPKPTSILSFRSPSSLVCARNSPAWRGKCTAGCIFGVRPVLPVAEVKVEGTASLVCQRCLETMQLGVETSTEVGLIATEADANRVPEELEPVLAPEGRISVGELVEEELLLTLPIVPLHGEDDACEVAPSAPLADNGREEETQKPFEQLAELLKRQ